MENIFFNNEQKNFYNLNPTPNELPRQLPYYNKFLESVYLQPNQGSTKGILFDPAGINDPTNWSLLPQRQPLTEAQVRSETQALSLLHGDVVNATLLSSNGWGTDSSQALLLRQMLGKPAFNEIVVNEEDVNDNNLTIQEAQLNAFAKTDLQNPENLLAFKKQSEVVAYLKARLNGFEPKPIEISAGNFYRSQGFIGKLMADTLDFDFKKSGMDVANWLGLISDDNYKMFHNISYGGLPSTSMTDIVAAVEKFDKNFDPKVWFNTKIASDPYVKDGLLNYGVTEDTFYRARNETHAKMMLMSQMNISNIQQHISDYLPNNWQKTVGFVKSFKDGLVASGVDVVAELGVDLGISAGISLIPTGVTQAAGVGKAGFSLFKFGSRVASWGRWGLTGELPRYAMQWGVVRRTLATAAVSGGWGAVADYAGQQNNIALANSLYYYNPEMKSTFDWDEVGNAAMTGALFGGSLGVLGSALSSISPAFHNARVKRLAAAGLLSPEQAKKAMQQSPFSITLNNFKRLTNGSLFKNVDPIAGTIHTAVSQGKQPELADINDASRTAANAVDVAEATTKPDQADTTLKPSLDNRGVREELIDYVDRGIRGGTIKSIGDVLNNLSPLRPWNSLSNKQQVYLLEQLDVPSVQKKLKSIIDDPAAPDTVKKLATDLDSEVQLLTETKAKLRSSLTAEDVASIDEAIKLNKPLDEVQPATTNPTKQTVIDVFNAAKNNTAAPSVTATPEAVVTPSVAATTEAVVTPKEPAIKVTQERVDAATTEARVDMDLRTESELKDPKVEQEIKDNVEEMLFGRDGKPTLRRILRGSRKARKLSPAQQKRITTVLTNPAAFIEEARGNKEHITAYYNKMKEFVAEGRLTEADVRIILAATVNLNWNSGAASIISKLVGGTRYSVDPTTAQVTVGEYLGKSEQMLRVQNVLHEVGHVFEILSHGSSLMNMRKLFSSEADFIVSLQEVLDTDKVNKYYIAGNTQELMAEAFSVMMIDEVRLAAFLSQAPNQGLVRKMLMQKFVSVGQSLLDVLDSLKLSKVLQEEQVFKTVKEMLLVLDKNSGLLISRVMYQNTVVDILKDNKQLTTKELKDKLNRELIKRFQPTQDELTLSQKQISYLFTEDEVAVLVEYTSSEQATPLHIDAFLNTKLDGLDLKKNRDEFIQTMTGYLNINKKYFSSVIDIYNQALVENGYEPIKRSGLETEISPADITQYLNTIKKTDQKVARKTMLSTPDVLMHNYFSYSLGKASAKLGAPVRALEDLTLIEQLNRASVLLKRIDGFALLRELKTYLYNFRKDYMGTSIQDASTLKEQTLLTPVELSLFILTEKSTEFNELAKTIEVTTIKHDPEIHGTNPSKKFIFKPNKDKTGGTLELLDFGTELKNIGSVYSMFQGFAEAAVVLNKTKKLKKILETIKTSNPITQAEKTFANSKARDPLTGKLAVIGHYTPIKIPRKSGKGVVAKEWNAQLKASLLNPNTDMFGYGVYLTNRESDGYNYVTSTIPFDARPWEFGEYAYYYYANIENPIIINPVKEGIQATDLLQDRINKLKKEYMEKYGLKTDQELAMHLDAGPGQWAKHFSAEDARINYRYEKKQWNYPEEWAKEYNEAQLELKGEIPTHHLNVLLLKKLGYDGIIAENMSYSNQPRPSDRSPSQELRHYVVFEPSKQLIPVYSDTIIPNDSPQAVKNTVETLGHIDGLLGAPKRNEGQINTLVFAPQRETELARAQKDIDKAEKLLREITDKTLVDKLTEGLFLPPKGKVLSEQESLRLKLRDNKEVLNRIKFGLNTGELQIDEKTGILRFATPYEDGTVNPIAAADARKKPEITLTLEQEKLLGELVQDLSTDKPEYPRRIFGYIVKKASWAAKNKAAIYSTIADVLTDFTDGNFTKYFIKKDGTLVDTQGMLIARLATAVVNKYKDEKKKLVFKTSAGLTPKNWREFIDKENESLKTIDTPFGKRGEKLSSDKLDSDWLAAEERNQTQLFLKFEKEYKKVVSTETEQVGTETVITGIEKEDQEFGETVAAKERKEAADQLVEFANLGYEIYGKNKATIKRRKFVVESYADGLTPEQILEKAKEKKINLDSTKAIVDTLSDVRVESRKIINEEVKKRFNKSIDEISGKDLLYVLKELQKPQEPKQIPPAPSRQEIIEQVTESVEQQNEVNSLNTATESTPPNTKPTIPIIKPEETVGPVTVVANRRNKKVTPLTPHVDPAVAEKAMDGRPRDGNGQFVSSGVRTSVDWTTASAAAWHNADGMAGNLFFSSLKTIQTILNGVSHPRITKENAGALLVYIKQLYKDGKEKEAVSRFLELMKKLDIKAVRVVDPRTGQTTMKFLFSEYEWSYGGITREEPVKETVSKPTTAPKAAPRASKEKPIPQPSEKPKATEAKPRAAKRTVKVTVERGPDNKDIPVIEPVEKPDTTTQAERLEDTKGSDNRPGTDLPLTTEAEQIMVGLTESNESLRDGGTDASSFKHLLAKFFKSLDKKTRDALQSGIPDVFKEIFLEFVDINSAIMHRNRERFKNDPNIVQKFWKQVTKLLAEEDANRVSVKYYKAKTLRQIYNEAAQSLSVGNNKFTPPLIPDNITIKNGRMSISGVDKNLLDFINNRDKAPIIPPSKEAMAARQQEPKPEPMPGVDNSKPKEPEPIEVDKEERLTENEVVDNILEVFNNSSSMTLRQNNLISWIFGGSERSNRNIWRSFMSKAVNFIQSKARMGSTIRSMQRSMRLLSALFDDSRTMIGQLVAPGATPLRSANKAKLEAVMLVSNLAKIHRAFAFEISKLELTNAQVKVLQRLQIEAWQKKASPTAKEIQDLLKVKNADDLAAIMDEYRTEMIHINKTILDLERKTDWREVVDKNGDAIPEDEYLPIQIVIKKLNAILVDNKKYSELIRSLVETRKQSKLNDEKLDINTLIVMGILDIKDVKTFYTRNRKFVQTEASNLDSETLAKLFVTTVTSPEGLDKYFGINGKKYFTIQKGSDIHVFKVPETIEDLSKADLDKYYKTVSGSAEHVLDKWKTEFAGLSLIEVEMRELLDYKAKRGRHARKVAGTRNDRPDIDTNHYEDYQSTVRNFSTEEILGNPELFELARTDLHAAYQNFVRYRAFDLLFQETIDKLAGQTGLRPKQFLMLLEQRILKYIDEFDSIKPEHKEYHKQDVYDGITRLLWQYAEYNGSTPKSGLGSRQARNAAKSLRGVINMSGGIAYGAAQASEATGEFIKSSIRTGGLSIPVGIFRLFSNLLNVHVRGNSHQRFQIEDLATSLEDWHQEHATHFNEGVADANFDMDLTKPYSAIWETPAISGGMSDKVADILNKSGQTAVLLGGVTDNTNLTRYYAKARHFRKLLKMIKSGKLRKFLELREEPTTRAEMNRLLKESERSEKAERQLTKLYRRLAREAGLNEFDAIYAVTSGLVDIQSLDAISWGLNQTNALDGIIDFRELHLAYRDLVNMSNPSIDPEVYKKSIVAFQDGIERRIRKRSVTTLSGLNKSMGLLEGSETGKLIGSVTSYMSSYFDDVMLNAPDRGTVNLVLGGIVFYAVIETMVGLFREWASGRDVEDILQELESDPEGVIIRVATRMPIMGAFTPLLEAAIRTVHSFTGGSSNPNQLVQSMVSTGVGGSPAVGINSALSLSRKIFNAAQGVFEDDPTTSPGQKILAVPGHFINKSPLMIPARILEERANMDDTNALQWILNGIQTPATPYASRAGRGRSGGYRSVPLGMETYTPKPQAQRNFAKEQAMQIPRVPPSMQIPRVPPSMQTKGTPAVKDGQVQSVKVNTQGVSPLLPELLGGSQ